MNAQVIFLHDQQQQVLSVVNGAADVAFVRADQPGVMASQGLLNISDIKILSPVSLHAFACMHRQSALLAVHTCECARMLPFLQAQITGSDCHARL